MYIHPPLFTPIYPHPYIPIYSIVLYPGSLQMEWTASAKRNVDKGVLEATLRDIQERPDEHDLIVRANDLLVGMDEDILLLYKLAKDIYSKRFPELETTNLSPVQYARSVLKLGNDTELRQANLSDILPPSLVLIISMSATITSGKPLSEAQFDKAVGYCQDLLALEEAKMVLLNHLESQMVRLAPNLSSIVGTSVAARLVGIAGGIQALARLPANVIQVGIHLPVLCMIPLLSVCLLGLG